MIRHNADKATQREQVIGHSHIQEDYCQKLVMSREGEGRGVKRCKRKQSTRIYTNLRKETYAGRSRVH